MTIGEFIELYQGDGIDVYDNYTEELAVAYCGEQLTAAGKEHFEEALEIEVDRLLDGVVVIRVDEGFSPMHACERRLRLAKELFESMAGLCSASKYDEWFCER